jgi:CheY-like chemotaxis protein
MEDNQAIVLIVDDEKAVRNVIGLTLRTIGVGSVEAENKKTACEQLQNNPKILLALVDVRMGATNGVVVAEELKRLRLGLKIVYMTGYSAAAAQDEYNLKEGDKILLKPFTTSEFQKSVLSILRNEGWMPS